ncbi:unnamed protein product [Aphis gossypii]|uniref:Uncharacterized protein n=1 Tax=Aphis gossypii TaxID=80765 RepID=A0A9P0JFH6_APHGO|nr:unnamed protein product [Aphis gossypii]
MRKTVEKIKKKDGRTGQDGYCTPSHQHDGTLALRNLTFSMVLFVILSGKRPIEIRTTFGRRGGRHALGRACGGARRFKRRRRRFRFQKFFAYFYRLVLCYPHRHIYGLLVHIFLYLKPKFIHTYEVVHPE